MWIFEYFFEYLSQNGEYLTKPYLAAEASVNALDAGFARGLGLGLGSGLGLGVRVGVGLVVRLHLVHQWVEPR